MSRQVRRAERAARQAELPFWRQRSFLAAALFVGVVVVAGLFLLLTADDRPQAGSAPTQSPAATATATAGETAPETAAVTMAPAEPDPSPGQGSPGDCPTWNAESGRTAVEQAPQVQWSPVGDVATASSTTDGPAVAESPVRCYAPTAAGALLAAHNFTAEANSNVPLSDLVEQRVARDGPVYDVVAADAAAGRQGSGTSFTVLAYRFIDVADDQHTVALVYSVPQSSSSALLEMRVTMRWLEDDWWVWDSPEPRQISDVPAGFIEWGPLVGTPE